MQIFIQAVHQELRKICFLRNNGPVAIAASKWHCHCVEQGHIADRAPYRPHSTRQQRASSWAAWKKTATLTGVTRSPETDKRTFRLCRTTANIASSREIRLGRRKCNRPRPCVTLGQAERPPDRATPHGGSTKVYPAPSRAGRWYGLRVISLGERGLAQLMRPAGSRMKMEVGDDE